MSYVDERHDPEGVVHIGILLHSLMGQVALSYVVLSNGTVSQHVPEMMYDLSAIPRVIPTAHL